LTDEDHELCDSFDQPTPAEISAIRLAWETPAAQLARWPQLHIARAELLARLGRRADAARAYQAALDLAPAAPERDFIGHRIRELAG
jgi:predicted RNA polymerase sigma factor